MKNKQVYGFTLIELLVVIVIIGILATISTNLFSGQSSQARIGKYRAERAQASKERYEECIGTRTDHCGPEFMIYRNPLAGNATYQKNIISGSSDQGVRIIDDLGTSYALTPDGKFLLYRNDSEDFEIYKKELNSMDSSDPGTSLTGDSGSSMVISPDGRFMFYEDNGTSEIYRYDFTSDTSDLFLDGIGSPSFVTADGDYLVYIDWGNAAIYKKSTQSSADSSEDLFLNVDNTVFAQTPDGKYFFYNHEGDEVIYKKSFANSDPSDLGTVFIDSNSIPQFITADGNYLFYRSLGSNATYKKNIQNTNASDLGTEVFDIYTGTGPGVVTFP